MPVELEVASEPIEVKLQLPFAFDFRFQLQDERTEEPIALASASLTRDDPVGDWPKRRIEGETDAAGFVRLPGVSPGSWKVTVNKMGYVENSATFEMPGGFDEAARREGVVDLPIYYTVSETVVRFKLVGKGDVPNPEDYEIAHTHEGMRVTSVVRTPSHRVGSLGRPRQAGDSYHIRRTVR